MVRMNRYLALGDSMSIDKYTGQVGGGAVARFFRDLGPGWGLEDQTQDGNVMEDVSVAGEGDLITLTIGGNNLLAEVDYILAHGLEHFSGRHAALLGALRAANPEACLIVGNVYEPAQPLPTTMLDKLHEANDRIAANVAEVGARLADIHHAFRGNEDAYLTQVIEPNLAGAARIAELFRDAYAAA